LVPFWKSGQIKALMASQKLAYCCLRLPRRFDVFNSAIARLAFDAFCFVIPFDVFSQSITFCLEPGINLFRKTLNELL
jgi:hypothetical protein